MLNARAPKVAGQLENHEVILGFCSRRSRTSRTKGEYLTFMFSQEAYIATTHHS